MRVPQVALEAPSGAVLCDAAKSAGAAHGLGDRDLLAGLLKAWVRQDPAHSLLCAAAAVPPIVVSGAMAACIGDSTAATEGQRTMASGRQLSSWLHPQISVRRAGASQGASTCVSSWVSSRLTRGCVDRNLIEAAAVPVAPKQDAIIGSPVEGAVGDAAAAVQTGAPTAEGWEVVQRMRLPAAPCAAFFKPASLQQRLRSIHVSGRRLLLCMPNGCWSAAVPKLFFDGVGRCRASDGWESRLLQQICFELSWCTGRE